MNINTDAKVANAGVILLFEFMQHKSLHSVLVLVCVFLASCATPNPTPAELSNASFEPRPDTQQIQNALKNYGFKTLIDPNSAMYIVTSEPKKGWAKPSFYIVGHQNDPTTFGWVFTADINSRNRLGGYVGRRPYVFVFKNGTAYSATEDHTSNGTPINCPFGYAD